MLSLSSLSCKAFSLTFESVVKKDLGSGWTGVGTMEPSDEIELDAVE